MTLCQQCGREWAENATHCSSCGAPATPQTASSPPPPTATKAIVGLLLALIPCPPLPLVGLGLSILARGEVKRSNGSLKGDGFAIAGIVISSIWLAFTVATLLALVAVPNFLKSQVRSRQTEAKVNLKALSTRVDAFVQAHGGAVPQSFEALEASPQASWYTYYMNEGNRVASTHATPFARPKGIDFDHAVVTAIGNLDGDDYLDVWTIDAQGQVWHLRDDEKNRELKEKL